MKLSRKHKLYGVVLGLGLVAVLIDRVFILEEEASAGPQAPPPAVVTPPATVTPPVAVVDPGPAPDPVAVLPARQLTIADRLDQAAVTHGLDLVNVRDAFAPSPAWLAPDPDEDQLQTRETRGERFLKAHTLTAVMASGEDGYVIIDRRTLFIGQELDGFTLVSVAQRSAVLKSGSESIELTLPQR